MKTTYLRNAGITAGIVLLALSADAQRGGRGGFRGGFGRGFGGGISVRGGGLGLGFYRAYPRIGISIGVLPVGYYPFFWGSAQYYYYDGTFYQPMAGGGGYQVAVPPVGAEVPNLPKHAHSIVIDGQQYFELQGVYYKAQTTPEGKVVYIVAGKDGVLNTDNGNNTPPPPRVGDITDQLPEGCRRIKLNGNTYYVSPDEIYFEEIQDGNRRAYRIVSLPEPDGDGNNQQ